MAAALAITPGSNPLTDTTVAGTGFTALTAYDVRIAAPGGQVTTRTVTSDGSGAFSLVFTPQGRGTYTVNAYLAVAVSAANASASIYSDN